MRVVTTVLACALVLPASDAALAQAPVREGLSRAGQAVAEGAQAAVQGAANVAGGVADAAKGAASAIDRGPQARWRFTRHNGQWWYYTPQNQWLYHRDGQWHAYSAAASQDSQQTAQLQNQPHATGYRGVAAAQNAAVPSDQAQQPTPQVQPSQQAYPSANVAAANAYGGRRYSYGADVSRVPAGSERDVESRYQHGANAPREINNNPRSATWGAVVR